MRRTILALTLAVLLATALAACGSSDEPAPAATSAAPEPAATQTGGASGSSDEVAQLYAGSCAGCHGADGAGGSAKGITGEDDVAEIRRWIEQGGEGMPGFADQMPPGQIEALAAYVAGGLQ